MKLMKEKEMTKHNLSWFINRISKKVKCNDHESPDGCEGILIESSIVVSNLFNHQRDRNIRFYDTS